MNNNLILKKWLFTILFFSLLGFEAFAQIDPSLIWAKGIGNEYLAGGNNNISDIKVDALGNRYVTGNFTGTTDFDPTAGTAYLTAVNGDIFIAKYDPAGNYLWAINMVGVGQNYVNSLALDSNGNVIITGHFTEITDFDSGVGVANLTSPGGINIFLAKYDTSGNYLWAKSMGGPNASYSGNRGNSLSLDPSGNILLTGSLFNTADFDPSAGIANLTSAGESDIFFAKYDSLGNYLWAKSTGGTDVEQGSFLGQDSSGNIFVTGYFRGTCDFDPSAGVVNLTAQGTQQDMFLAKYDALGNYVWVKAISGFGQDSGQSVALDASGNVIVTGTFSGTANFNPVAGTANLTAVGSTDIFLAKYDTLGNYVWAKSISGNGDEFASSIVLDGSGNMFLTGNFVGTTDVDPSANTADVVAESRDIFLAKYDAAGNYMWAKVVGGTQSDIATALSLDSSGNVIIAGRFMGTIDFDSGVGVSNVSSGFSLENSFIASYTSANGAHVSSGSIYANGASNISLNSVVRDSAGNVYVAGDFSGTMDFDPSAGIFRLASTGNTDVVLAKYDALGNYVWAKAIGGTSIAKAVSIALDSMGNLLITGSFAGSVDFDPGVGVATLTSTSAYDIYIAKYDASGNYIWAKSMAGTGSDTATALALDSSGNIIITGSFGNVCDFDPSAGEANLTSMGSEDIFLAKYDASGNYLWAFSRGSTSGDRANSIALDGSGNVFITGYFRNTIDFDPGEDSANLTSAGGDDIFFAKYDATGNYVWAKRVGGGNTDRGNSIALDGSGNIIVTGYFRSTPDFDPSAATANLSSAGGDDIFLAKYDATGNYVWAKRMGGPSSDRGIFLALDGSDNVIITGGSNGQADFDPGDNDTDLTNAGDYDIFLAKYDATGKYVWAQGMGSSELDQGNSLVLDGSGNVVLAGIFRGTVDFDPSEEDITNLTSMSGGMYGFISFYKTATLGTEQFESSSFNLYPNPTSGLFNINYSKNITEVSVVNLLGQVVFRKKTNTPQVQVDLSAFPIATYLVKVVSEGQTQTLKILKSK